MPATLPAIAARAIAAALPANAGLEATDVAALLATPPDPSLGDLAFPCFRLAKTLRSAPAVIATELAARLADDATFTAAVAAGPYVNLRLALAEAALAVLPESAAGRLGTTPAPASSGTERVPERIMVEYSQPNTHKGFHVGHMRNLCLGDALVRCLRACGYEVIAANYLGDVGAHIAKCLWWYRERLSPAQRTPPERQRGEWLGELYAQASNQLDAWNDAAKAGDAAAAAALASARERTTAILQGLEARTPDLEAVWRETRQWSIDDFDEIYRWCGVEFDRVFFESEVDEAGLRLVEEYLARGVFVESEGAVGIVNDEVKHMPFFMLRKRDGTSLYSTKDLALARLKFEEHRVTRSIYVVDSRQSDHFRHVFLTLAKMGFAQAAACEHVPYEMVELPDGPMATRKGNVILFRTLRETMTDYVIANYLEKYRGEWPDEEITASARCVALGAIKYGMLQRDVQQKIVFDLQAWLDLEGNTGPYLQYAVARLRSILRKCAAEGKELTATTPERAAAACGPLAAPEERELVLALDAIPAAVEQVAAQLRPSILCTALYTLAKAANRFVKACNVKASEGALLQGRLLLVVATAARLEAGLAALGIPCPPRM
jgi:arginyl-tRNA synthetase